VLFICREHQDSPDELYAFAFDRGEQIVETGPIVLVETVFDRDDRILFDLLEVVGHHFVAGQLEHSVCILSASIRLVVLT
jgi:hypothetical protein